MTTDLHPADLGHALVRAQFALMAHGDLADFRRAVHPNATNREAAAEPLACRVGGPEGTHATALWLRAMFSGLHWEIHEIVAEGDLVVAHTTMTGRNTGRYTKYDADGGVAVSRPATGRSFAVRQTHWYRIADGMIIEHWANRDDLGMALQLGFLGPPTD